MDPDKPKVSIIIPTYNRSATLPESMRSVLDQSFRDFELIIVDDGSTDQTADVVGQIQPGDPRIHYLKLPINRGVGFARDMGLREAKGEYIAWIDSDDLWLSGKLVAQVNVLDTFPEIDILFGDYWNIDHGQETRIRGFSANQKAMNMLRTRHILGDLFVVEGGVELALLSAMFIHLQTVMFRAGIIPQFGGFDPLLQSAEDFEFLWRAALFGARYAYQDCPLVERHKGETSVTMQKLLPWYERLKAFHRSRQWCESAHREDLFSSIRVAEERAWCNLLWAYGRQDKRLQVLRTYRKSLVTGFSIRILLFAISAFLGKRAISLIDW